jgi:hypothetical protein
MRTAYGAQQAHAYRHMCLCVLLQLRHIGHICAFCARMCSGCIWPSPQPKPHQSSSGLSNNPFPSNSSLLLIALFQAVFAA